MAFFAHIHTDHAGIHRVQTATEHCRNTAEYARNCLADAGLGNSGYLAGLTHDCGKFKQEFLLYSENPNGIRGSVNHTFAGCRLLLELFHDKQFSRPEELTDKYQKLALLASDSNEEYFFYLGLLEDCFCPLRCNRHGEIPEPVPVYVVPYLGEKLGMLPEIKDAKTASDSLLEVFRRAPERFDHDLSSDKAIGWYHRKLYSAMPVGHQDFHIKKKNTSLFELLSCNLRYYAADAPTQESICSHRYSSWQEHFSRSLTMIPET